MKEILKQLISIAKTKEPTVQVQFNEPATEKEIEELEFLINKKLPKDFVQFYSLANGNNENDIRLFNGLCLLPISEIIFHWQGNKEMLESGVYKNTTADCDAAMKADWWNINWIPITYNLSSDHLVLDLDPTDLGTYGQVCTYWHDPSTRSIEANSFTHFLENTIKEIENAVLRFDADYNGFIKF